MIIVSEFSQSVREPISLAVIEEESITEWERYFTVSFIYLFLIHRNNETQTENNKKVLKLKSKCFCKT